MSVFWQWEQLSDKHEHCYGQFVIGGSIVDNMEPITDIVDLFVDLGTMVVVSLLASMGTAVYWIRLGCHINLCLTIVNGQSDSDL